MNKSVWQDLHKHYRAEDWIDKPSMFAQQIVDLELLPHSGDLLELGAGLGQDSRFFAAAGYNVIATDLETTILDIDQSKVSADIQSRIQFQQMDLREPFPIEDNAFDIVYAHLSLHYFSRAKTEELFAEIYRVLKPGGTLAFLVNSTDDPEYDTGFEIEPDFYQIDKTSKRYFSVETTREFTAKFESVLLDNNGETYKDSAKGIHHLIRYVGRKKV